LRILILNWRCPRNPLAGGAESVTFELARRLVLGGDAVEWFSASFPGAPPEEMLDGVRIVRAGRQWTVHWKAFQRYRRVTGDRFDVVVDQVNTVPFFTPFWANVPQVMFIHQLAREVWWYESPFPLNAIGFVAEPIYLRAYRSRSVITVSESTRADLLRLGFKKRIAVIPQGLEPLEDRFSPPSPPHQVETATFLYVGRLTRSKRVADIVRAFGVFVQEAGQGTLTLLGDGPPAYVDELRALAARLGILQRIRFLGRVSAEQKHQEMAGAHALLLASVREGWGLVVTEAAALGTPAIAYDVPGLRDSVRHEETGLLVKATPEALAQSMLRVWRDPNLHERLSSGARSWSHDFSFDRTEAAFRDALDAALDDSGSRILVHGR
jgi:glycosyltransferase involved in cell wall biosynthesis